MEPKPADLRANLLIRSGNESEGALSSATISPCQAAVWARCLVSWVEAREVLYESLFYHPLTSKSVSVETGGADGDQAGAVTAPLQTGKTGLARADTHALDGTGV